MIETGCEVLTKGIPREIAEIEALMKTPGVIQVLKDRQTRREFSPGCLSPQTLSNLLWAAWGINRPDVVAFVGDGGTFCAEFEGKGSGKWQHGAIRARRR